MDGLCLDSVTLDSALSSVASACPRTSVDLICTDCRQRTMEPFMQICHFISALLSFFFLLNVGNFHK
uniref:Uncharacterized protein n=1 Tax=Anguilla anguilla TaxID=7936 RepID=A0A0E9XTU3_ANGAN